MILAYFVEKLVAVVTSLCLLFMGVSQMNSLTAKTLSQNHACDIFVYFDQNLVAMAMSLRPLSSKMSFSDWPTMKTRYK